MTVLVTVCVRLTVIGNNFVTVHIIVDCMHGVYIMQKDFWRFPNIRLGCSGRCEPHGLGPVEGGGCC